MANISVVVAARNYGRFLTECLESIAAQTVPPSEIVYSDDGSEDESVAVAHAAFDQMSRRIETKVVSQDQAGVCAARNAGVARTTGQFLVHVDGDDVLTPTFLQEHLTAMTPVSSFAYGPAESFGLREAMWEVPAWNAARLWSENYVNTSAMVRRVAFEMAGGWREGCGTMWDWDMALRLSRRGFGVPSKGLLRYRQHGDNWSMTHEGKFGSDPFAMAKYRGMVRRQCATASICCPFSGRIPRLFSAWLDAISKSIRQFNAGELGCQAPELIVLDNSQDGIAGTLLSDVEPTLLDAFGGITCVAFPPAQQDYADEQQRRDAVASFMASACNRLLDLASGEIVWFVEDDVVMPPLAYGAMLTSLTDGDQPLACVSGLYRNRHLADEWVAHYAWNGKPKPVVALSANGQAVDLAGTGCLMIFRPLAGHRFTSHWHRSAAHDWAWCEQLRVTTGQRVWLLPRVRCRHFQTEEAWV